MKTTFRKCLKQLRKYAMNLDNDMKCPIKYKKYNRKDRPPPLPEFDNPGGRAWFMFILDEFEKKNL